NITTSFGRTYPNTHQNPPKRQYPRNFHPWALPYQRLCKRRPDDKYQLKSIYMLSSQHVRQPAKAQLAYDRPRRSRKLDRGIARLWDFAVWPEDVAEHYGDHVDGKDL